jgi:hypothetical protein
MTESAVSVPVAGEAMPAFGGASRTKGEAGSSLPSLAPGASGTKPMSKAERINRNNERFQDKTVYSRATTCLAQRVETEVAQVERQRQANPTEDYAVGMCPDMCPEIERYRRAATGLSDTDGHVWQLETTEGILDHRRAIKEYRKEAADSRVEAPSLLRPAHVLDMTMQYLMVEIMEMPYRGPMGLRERAVWYEFLSNRLRAIRKDIKTQNLCTPLTMELLEQSVRFHIFAGWFMRDVEEFDRNRKLNDDRLQDTLGMLEAHYQDLRNAGVSLPHEAEIRTYQTLASLGHPAVLRKVQVPTASPACASPSPSPSPASSVDRP